MTEDVEIEIIETDDGDWTIWRKDGHEYSYPLSEVQNIVARLEDSGANIIDSRVEGRYTVYSQPEEFYPREE